MNSWLIGITFLIIVGIIVFCLRFVASRLSYKHRVLGEVIDCETTKDYMWHLFGDDKDGIK